MSQRNEIRTRTGLQLRMTAFVTAVVLLVSAIILTVMFQLISRDYIRQLDERLADDITSITQTIEQRMLRIEDATRTMALIAPPLLEDESDIDSLLLHTFEGIDEAGGVSFVFRNGFKPDILGYYERYVRYDKDNVLRELSYVNDEDFKDNQIWLRCYGQGESFWGEPLRDSQTNHLGVCYYVPLLNEEGERIGMAYSGIRADHLTTFVTKYKAREDFDISIYSREGVMVVAPDDYIREISPEDLFTQERAIDHLGWKIILSADRNIIDREVHDALMTLTFLIILMFIVTAAAIFITVRLVARPFIERQRKTEKDKAVMENEMRLAADAQNELLPHEFPLFPENRGIDVSACLYPARDVGGDLYDYFIKDGYLCFCIGDVSGKGVPASLFMSATHYLFRSAAMQMSAAKAVGHMNDLLCAGNEQCRFVTFWFGRLDLSTGEVEYVNAGHNAPILLSGRNASTLPMSENLPLGIQSDIEFVSGRFRLMSGDGLLLFTDGITEAMDANAREFGGSRLLEVVARNPLAGASGMISDVLEAVRTHAQGTSQSDDITMLCLRFLGTEA